MEEGQTSACWSVERSEDGQLRVRSLVSLAILERRLRRAPKHRINLCLRLLRFQETAAIRQLASGGWESVGVDIEAVAHCNEDLHSILDRFSADGLKDELSDVCASLPAGEHLRNWRNFLAQGGFKELQDKLTGPATETGLAVVQPSVRLCLFLASIAQELSDKTREARWGGTEQRRTQRYTVDAALRAINVIFRNFSKDAKRLKTVTDVSHSHFAATGGRGEKLMIDLRPDGRVDVSTGEVVAEDSALDPADGFNGMGISGLFPALYGQHGLPKGPWDSPPSPSQPPPPSKSARKRERQKAKLAAAKALRDEEDAGKLTEAASAHPRPASEIETEPPQPAKSPRPASEASPDTSPKPCNLPAPSADQSSPTADCPKARRCLGRKDRAAKAAAQSTSATAAKQSPRQRESRAEVGQGALLPGNESRAEPAEPSDSPPPASQAVSKSPLPEPESLPASYPEPSAATDPSPPSTDSLEARRRFAREELERLGGAERSERPLVGRNVRLRRLLHRLREQNAAWRR